MASQPFTGYVFKCAWTEKVPALYEVTGRTHGTTKVKIDRQFERVFSFNSYVDRDRFSATPEEALQRYTSQCMDDVRDAAKALQQAQHVLDACPVHPGEPQEVPQ